MKDTDRVANIKIFAKMYSPDSEVTFLAHMPRESTDSNSVLFNEYFDMLQSIFAARNHDQNQVETVKNILPFAKKFSYPLYQIRALLMRKNELT